MDYKKEIDKKIKITFENNKLKDCVGENTSEVVDSKKKVLIIDDDKLLHDLYAAKFNRNGFNTKTASSCDEALSVIKCGFAPDILMIDLMIPIVDGFEIYEKIKNEKLAPKAIAIMLTNKGLSEEIEKAKKHGFHGFIIKALTIPQEVVDKTKQIYEENCK